MHENVMLVPVRILLTAVLSIAMAAGAQAQNDRFQDQGQDQGRNGRGEAPRDGQGDGGERRDRRSFFDFPDEATSKDNEMLKRVLARFPDSDADKDGVLNAAEARAFMAKQREQWRQRRDSGRRGRIEPTHSNIPYGKLSTQVIDFYLAESEDPTPMVVFFHGGQFIAGDENDTGTLDIRALLDAGISVASIDYREASENPFPAPFEDAARAVQFIRHYAELFNIDPERLAGHGEEAGGNLALYLALHDDLAEEAQEEPTSEEEPVAEGEEQEPKEPNLIEASVLNREDYIRSREAAREAGENLRRFIAPQPVIDMGIYWDKPEIAVQSTRLLGVVARHPIASFDPRSWAETKLPMNDHERLMKKYLDVRYLEPLDDKDVIALVEDISPLALVSSDDPPLLLMNQYPDSELTDDTVWTIMRHHPEQSKLIAKAMRSAGNRVIHRYRGMSNDPGTSSIDFLTDLLK